MLVTIRRNASEAPLVAEAAVSKKGATLSCPDNAMPNSLASLLARSCRKCPVEGLSACNSLKPDELGELDSIVVECHYRHKDTLFAVTLAADYVHIITEGVVRLHRTLADGRHMISGFAMPGDFLGLSIDGTYANTADALGYVSTCRISRRAYSDLINSKPRLLHRLYAETTHELTQAHDQMMLLGRCNAVERTAIFLINLRNRWMRINGQSAYISLPMTRQDIGDFIGLTVETVSRTITKFAREKLIVVVPNGVRVLDYPGLEAVAAAGSRTTSLSPARR